MQAISTHSPSRARSRTASALLEPAMAFLAIAIARVVYVSLYGASIPFWDQWDELNQQLRPLLDGTWHVASLFTAHNEHRILFTRLISIGLFAANDHVFDNLVECYSNALLYAGLWTLVYVLLTRGEGGGVRRWQRWSLLAGVIALGSLPFDWENALVGFQNQFYLMELAAVAMIGVAAYSSLRRSTSLVFVLLAIASVFTMAAGVLAVPAACAVVLLRARNRQIPSRSIWFAIGTTLVIAVVGVAMTPHQEGASLAAHGWKEHLNALLTCLEWPLFQPASFRARIFFAAMLWLAFAVWLWGFFKNERGSKDEFFAAGLALWCLVQYAAIAHARGHDLQNLSSRYTEIPALALAANFWLALKQLKFQSRIGRLEPAALAIMVGLGATGLVFWKRTPGDLFELALRYKHSVLETTHVYRYLDGKQPFPKVPPGSIDLPYPRSGALQSFLDIPRIQSLLPRSLLPPSKGRPTPWLSRLAASTQRCIRLWFTNRR